jgi:hypothetical protein
MKKTITFLTLLFAFFTSKAQIVNSFGNNAVTHESAIVYFYLQPNCANGATFSVEYSTSPSFTPLNNIPGGSVSNVGYTRYVTLSPLNPSTLYYWRVVVQLGSGCSSTTYYSAAQTFITSAAPAATLPVLTNVSALATTNSATISYSINPNYGETTPIIYYGLSSNDLSNQVNGITANGGTSLPATAEITGLLPATTYYYQIIATNSAGTTNGNVLTFTTDAIEIIQTIADYNFDNTYADINGNNPFSSNTGTSFVADRNGNPNSAIEINNTGSIATIPGLPYGSSSRTFSFWVKLTTLYSPYNMTFSYGQPSNSNSQGGSLRGGVIDYFGYNDNLTSSVLSNVAGTWYFITYTYNGTTAKIYKNGALVGSSSKTWNTLNNSDLFRLGIGVGGEYNFHGAIDDLKIFEGVLSATQVDSLYNYTSPVTVGLNTINQKNEGFSLYPNPAQNLVNLGNITIGSTIKLMDVTSKLIYIAKTTAKETTINTADLNNGIYFIQIENEGAIAQKKLIINK